MISKLRRMMSKGQEGFTLIELMIVIAVIGILAGLAIPKITGVKDKADEAKVKSNLKIIQTGLEMYYAEHGSYPASQLTDIDDYVGGNISLSSYTYNPTTGGYIVSVSGSSVQLDANGIQ